MDMQRAAAMLDRVQRGKKPVPAILKGARVTLVPLDGNAFRILLDVDADRADAALRRLNDVAADITKGPAKNIRSAVATWDTTLNYLAMTEDLVIK